MNNATVLALAAAMTLTACGEDPNISKAKEAVAATTAEPAAAQFKDVKVYEWKDTGKVYVCGMVNAKNRQGGYDGFTRFVWTNKGERRVFVVAPGADSSIVEQSCREPI